ncbi:MAG: YraN family protein [Chloroflexales bacterium]|nr:YraN family protein [Chloroflexales bacterium]
MPSARAALGRLGEDAAAAHLARAGYTLITRNWRCPGGEIDLVALIDGQVVFVEVRTRRGGQWRPEESIGAAKTGRLRALAYAYLEHAGMSAEIPWRIDVIAVELDTAGHITRLEQIPYAVGES